MNAPHKNQHTQMPMPDTFGTGKQPVRQRSYLPITLILLLVLLGANLLTFAVFFSLRNPDGMQLLKTVLLPGSAQVGILPELTDGDRVQTGITPSGQTLSDGEISQKLLPSTVRVTAQTEPEATLGSGLVLTRDGYILTNSHSIEDTHALCVILSDGSVHTAVCIGADESSDLAVLKIAAQTLEPAELGDSDAIRGGDQLRLLSSGAELREAAVSQAEDAYMLSGKQTRMLEVDLERDGFLVNRSGQVVAIQIAAEQGDWKALPIRTAKELANDLINYGCVNPQASLGVQVTELSEIQRRYWQLPEGVMISRLALNGSAYLAGIRTGDLLLQVDAWQIKSVEDYQAVLELLHPGDTVQLLIYRHGQEYSITIVMQNAS